MADSPDKSGTPPQPPENKTIKRTMACPLWGQLHPREVELALWLAQSSGDCESCRAGGHGYQNSPQMDTMADLVDTNGNSPQPPENKRNTSILRYNRRERQSDNWLAKLRTLPTPVFGPFIRRRHGLSGGPRVLPQEAGTEKNRLVGQNGGRSRQNRESTTR
jgi:hypothetical protein